MQEALKGKKLSETEIDKITNQIQSIIKMVDNARKEKLEYSKETRDKALEVTGKVAGNAIIVGGALFGLKMILNCISNKKGS